MRDPTKRDLIKEIATRKSIPYTIEAQRMGRAMRDDILVRARFIKASSQHPEVAKALDSLIYQLELL